MLILSRQVEESIRLGDEVQVTVLSIKGNTVKLGLDAPRDVSIHRKEVYMRIQDGGPLKVKEDSA